MKLFAWINFSVIATVLALTACGQKEAQPAAPKTVTDFFPIKVGAEIVQMQLALSPGEMQRGLMERRGLGPNEGMLFLFRRPQRLSFWMHDTPLPLDVGYFDAGGKLREIYAMQPFDENTVTSHGLELQMALEMNQGWFRNRGVKPGAQIDVAALKAAITVRGYLPESMGLP